MVRDFDDKDSSTDGPRLVRSEVRTPNRPQASADKLDLHVFQKSCETLIYADGKL